MLIEQIRGEFGLSLDRPINVVVPDVAGMFEDKVCDFVQHRLRPGHRRQRAIDQDEVALRPVRDEQARRVARLQSDVANHKLTATGKTDRRTPGVDGVRRARTGDSRSRQAPPKARPSQQHPDLPTPSSAPN
ncbi:hypothetical protein [Micromonospora sp. WMMD980]|uniref:hypothetical protein n=1 Tax=Micromonospora sp. WMMD980 TaxID=3016088 RepID=UPI002416D9B6|nr:hypothetical protein [Micromonospora sp. WMMD980]MDG4803611.1 hypothetical protein [Micromonospora sp. WMMD980]